LAGLGQGKIWIDHSTTNYGQTQRFSVLVNAKGAQILEAPITGGLEALKKGQMTVFMAGERDLAELVSCM
jgi:3-hydroxyisobutyrate dehydrogenase-like beta-hydroxyacid dehydrogenase